MSKKKVAKILTEIRDADKPHVLSDTELVQNTIMQAGSPFEEWLHRDLLFAGLCLGDDIRLNNACENNISGTLLTRVREAEKGRKEEKAHE